MEIEKDISDQEGIAYSIKVRNYKDQTLGSERIHTYDQQHRIIKQSFTTVNPPHKVHETIYSYEIIKQ